METLVVEHDIEERAEKPFMTHFSKVFTIARYRPGMNAIHPRRGYTINHIRSRKKDPCQIHQKVYY